MKRKLLLAGLSTSCICSNVPLMGFLVDNACSDIYFPTAGIKAFRNKGCRALPCFSVQVNQLLVPAGEDG